MTDGGYLLLDKPPGVTSFEALSPVKRILGTGKVGHTGTLDKFASGLLIALTGRALKQQNAFTRLDKTYRAEILFGTETATLDPEGEPVAAAPPPDDTTLREALGRFRGPIMQTPPAYSAIHINGKRASSLSRQGIAPPMQPRPVTIYELTLLSYEAPRADIAVRCSSGTYIRALARDIALECGSRAHLTALARTAIGPFLLENAVRVDNNTKTVRVLPMEPI